MDTANQQLDQEAVNLAKAIRQTESGGNFEAKGKSGEYGAYQFMPDTWNAWSKQHLGKEVPLDKATPEIQNEVAYKVIKSLKDSGKNVAQIAAIWNSGSDKGWETKIGTNQKGVEYDVPKYVNKVATTYHQIKNSVLPQQGGASGGIDKVVQGISTPTTLVGNLARDLRYIAGTNTTGPKTGLSAITEGIGQVITGQGGTSTDTGRLGGLADIGRGTLNVAGGVGAMIGDVVGAGMQKGFKAIDSVLEKVNPEANAKLKEIASDTVNKVLQDKNVQNLFQNLAEYGENHPYIKNAAGDVFNIFTSLIPAAKLTKAGALITKNLFTGGLAAKVSTDQAGRAVLAQAKSLGIKDPFASVDDLFKNVKPGFWNKVSAGTISKKAAVNELYGYADDLVKAGEKNLFKSLAKSNIDMPTKDVVREAYMLAQSELGGNAQLLSKTVKNLNATAKIISDKQGRISLAKLAEVASKEATDPFIKQAIQKELVNTIKAQGLTEAAKLQEKLATDIITKRLIAVIAGQPQEAGLIRTFLAQTAEAAGTGIGSSMGPLGAYAGNKGGELLGRQILGNKKGLISQALIQKGTKGIGKQTGLLGTAGLLSQ